MWTPNRGSALVLLLLIVSGCASVPQRYDVQPTVDALNEKMRGKTLLVEFHNAASVLGAREVRVVDDSLAFRNREGFGQLRSLADVERLSYRPGGPGLRTAGTAFAVGAGIAAIGGIIAWRSCQNYDANDPAMYTYWGCGANGAGIAIVGGAVALFGSAYGLFVGTARTPRIVIYERATAQTEIDN